MKRQPALMKWLRPWIVYDRKAGQIGCLVCTFDGDGERPHRIGIRTVSTRRAAMRFFKQHQRCAPHAW